MIYFDNAATTRVRPEVMAVFTKTAQDYGNPDSLHQLGRQAKVNMEESRRRIAKLLGILPEEIIFTSCGSETNTLAVVGYALANSHRGKHLITTNVEHSSMEHAMDFLESLGYEITRLPIHENGTISLEELKNAMRKDTILVSILHVNNEMGAINPLKDIARIVHTHPTCKFHADCTQSFGKEAIPIDQLDLMTMSAHKIHGLKGSAMLIKKKNIQLCPIIQGGQQEQGLRGGTENTPANIALAKTIRLALDEQKASHDNAEKICDYLVKEIKQIPGSHIHSPQGHSPFILAVSFDGMTSEVLCNALDAKGVCVSARSTCDSEATGANPVLRAMGVSEHDATHSIRLSFSSESTLEEAKAFIKILKEVLSDYGLPL